MPGKSIRTTCAYCGVGCGIAAQAGEGRAVTIKGDSDHPANRGALCSKGTHLAETVGLEGRLLHPMIGEEQVGWDTAIDDVASRMRAAIDEHGPDAVAFYVSGQLLTEDYYVANKLMKGFVGSGNIDTNSRLCMASAVAAHNRAFGEDVVPLSYADLDQAELIVLLGSNTAWCHPVIWQRIEKARAQNGTKIVVIDPRRTETAALADLHVPVAPDGDVALFGALLGAMAQADMLDSAFIEQHCDFEPGFFAALDPAAHGIDPSVFAQFVELAFNHPKMVTVFSQGANQSVCGTDKGNAITNFHLATGRISKPGAGPFSMTGQPNAMGGREVGGLANMLACHLGFSEGELAAVRSFWDAPNLCSGPGQKAVEMFRSVHEGRIKFLWIMATNPAVSMPDAGFVREALARCPNVIVSDVLANTDTARFAHVRLPAHAWAEKDGTVTNSERYVSRQRGFLAPPGEVRADWKILCDIAGNMGFGEAFGFANAAAVFREYAAMTQLASDRGKMLDLTQWASCTDDEFEAMEPFQWGGAYPLANGFPTASGRAQLISLDAAIPAAPAGSLQLNTGRYRDHWHTMTRTGLSQRLSVHRREPLLEVSPHDAAAHALTDGGFARVSSAQGESIFRVEISEAQAPGQIFVPMHFTDMNSGGGRTGLIMHPATDPVSGQPGFKNVAANVQAYQPEWRAFLLTREPAAPDCAYWARARITGGWLTELAGEGAVPVDTLLPDGQRCDVSDIERGMLRMTVSDRTGKLIAALYVTRTGQLPGRDWIERQFADPDAGVLELLAGRPAVGLPDRGPIICVCHDVGEKAVQQAIGEGAGSVAAVGAKTCAGTNCGSCRPLIASLIKDFQSDLQEAAE